MQPIHPRLKLAAALAGALAEAAQTTARAMKKARALTQGPRGAALKPGTDTPLWNELALALRTLDWRYGEKANLARELGLPRQRIDDFIIGRRRLPDAERTLTLLHWLHARRKKSPTRAF
jgi:hypothetical protein